jgi:(R,R)-butanediol dehydrogenase/meso-butanediol dehydrogenase/diacetyl reductase
VVEQLGAVAVDPGAGAPSEQLRDATGGQGLDVIFETAGARTSFTDAVSSTAKQGTVVVVASGRHSIVAPLAELVRSEITVRTTYASCGEFYSVLDGLHSGAFPLDGWVSTLALGDLLHGLRRLHQGLDIKLVVDPWATTETT